MGPIVLEQATAEDVRFAASLARRVYTGHDVIPETRMLAWFQANPNGFTVLKTASGERAGNVDLLPLKPDALRSLLEGALLECEIAAAGLYTPAEQPQITQLYLESVVVRTGSLQPVPGGAAAVAAAFPSLVERLCDPARLTAVHAIAASPQGARFLSRLGFLKAASGADRRDGHDLYRCPWPLPPMPQQHLAF